MQNAKLHVKITLTQYDLSFQGGIFRVRFVATFSLAAFRLLLTQFCYFFF